MYYPIVTTCIIIRLFLAQTNSETGYHRVHHGVSYRLGCGEDPPGLPRYWINYEGLEIRTWCLLSKIFSARLLLQNELLLPHHT